jgi:hypothetical protein
MFASNARHYESTRQSSLLAYCGWALIVAMVWLGCAGSVHHDETAAAEKAEEFARIAFVQQDIANGYGLLADGTKRYVSLAQFKAVVERLHPRTLPKTVTATEYEPMVGENAIYIYLTGENSGEHFYYRLIMEGTATTGYRVLRLDRGGTPYPQSSDKKSFAARKNAERSN